MVTVTVASIFRLYNKDNACSQSPQACCVGCSTERPCVCVVFQFLRSTGDGEPRLRQLSDGESPRGGAGDTDYWEFFAKQTANPRVHERARTYLFMPNEKCLPQGFNLVGLTTKSKTVALHTGIQDDMFEYLWRPQRIRETTPDPKNLWIGYTDIVFPESVQEHKPSFRVSTKPSFGQQELQEHRLRLQDQAY